MLSLLLYAFEFLLFMYVIILVQPSLASICLPASPMVVYCNFYNFCHMSKPFAKHQSLYMHAVVDNNYLKEKSESRPLTVVNCVWLPQWPSQVQHIITELKYYENQCLCRTPSCHNFNSHSWVETILGTNIAAEVTKLAACTAKALDSKSCFSNLYSPL